MILLAKDFPSGLGIDPDVEFNMRPLIGADLKLLDQPMPTITQRTLVFGNMLLRTCPELAPHLTVYDVWYLVVKQWELVGSPIILDSSCPRPLYSVEVDGEVKQVYDATGHQVVGVQPCGGRSLGRILDTRELEIVRPRASVQDKPFDFLDLPRFSRLSTGSMETNSGALELWFTGTEFDDLSAPDVRKCCDWIAMMGHGVYNVHEVVCGTCGHVHPTAWEFGKEIFLC